MGYYVHVYTRGTVKIGTHRQAGNCISDEHDRVVTRAIRSSHPQQVDEIHFRVHVRVAEFATIRAEGELSS